MKVNLVGPVYPYRGGIAHYNATLAQALEEAGHHVRLISFQRQYPGRLYPGKSDQDPSTEPLSYPAEYLLDPLYPWTWIRTARSIRQERPDLLIFHWWTTFWAPAYTFLGMLVRRQLKVVFLIHNVLPHETKIWDQWMARTAFRQAHAFIVQAPHERERLLTLIPGSSRVLDSPHPAYQPFSEQRISKEEARQQLGLPADRVILLFFGIIRPYKGLRYLFDALARVQQPVHLVVAGEFWEDVTLYQKQIADLALTEKVTLINRYIPNEVAHQLYSAADGLVAPYVGGTQSGAAGLAIGYGLAMIVTERVAAGLPAGFPICKTAQDASQNNGYAQVVPAADPLALAQAIETLIARLPSLKTYPLPATGGWSRLVKVIEELEPGRS
jgi:glycosyltransferase involved in cell wall biosynthesis